jgi:hypothetical protein
LLLIFVLAGAGVPLAQDATSAAVRFDAERARVFRAAPGRGLTLPSSAAPDAIVRDFVGAQGRDQRTLQSLVLASRNPVRANGLTVVRLEQEIQGLRVHGAYARGALSSAGELVHLIDNLAPVADGITAPRIQPGQALGAALRELYPALAFDIVPAGKSGNTTTFQGGRFFYRAPSVTTVAVLMRNGSMQVGFLVETWSSEGNLLHHTLVGGDGRVLSVELRTSSDSYNVFTDNPETTPQTIVPGPGSGNSESPSGWLFTGDHSSVDIAGNNANAYLDTDANNASDGGGVTVSDGNFLASADLTQSPSTGANQAVSVQNLFYLNNVVHDVLYRHGFDEAAGNFQEDNFGNGGLESDSVNAEAQDGSGTDNANFATPTDGSNPRMQMFLWNPAGTHELVVNSPAEIAGSYAAAGAVFGADLDSIGVTGDVVLAVDSRGVPNDGCERISNGAAMAGNIALVDRGNCDFVKKAVNVQSAGAIAMIVANNVGGTEVFTMGGSNRRITIASVMISQNDGATIKAALAGGPVNTTMRRVSPAPPFRDSSVDSDVVYHEYGHGLTWRMIGSMSGPMSGAIGEGMSDVLAILLNGNDRVGEYSASDPNGIRSAPYTNYQRTYGDFSSTGVHFDGEIYGAIGWRLRENYLAAGQTVDTLLGDIVGGMNFTPAGPAFEDMRDGILTAAAATGRECLIWDAFADFGVGVGAEATVRGPNVIVTESFALPQECQQ